MKNMKILFLLFISYSQMKASEESAEFVVNAADSIQTSKALQKIADAQPKKSTTYGSSFVSFFNPSTWSKQADQNNPAVQHLHKIEDAIQDYYDNSKWFGKSTGNTKKQKDAKTEIESLVAQYRRKLDANDADFKRYESKFEDMIKDAQNQYSQLNLQEDTESLLQPMIDYFASLLSSQPADKKEEKPADKKTAVTASVALNNNSNNSYQYDNRTATKASSSTAQNNQSVSSEDNASAKAYAEKMYQESLIANKSNVKNTTSAPKEQEPTGWASQTLKYLNPAGSSKTEGPVNVPNINNPQSNSYEGYGKPTDKKSENPSDKKQANAEDAELLLTKMGQNIKDLQDKKSQLDNPKNGFNQFKKEKMTNDFLSIKEEFIANVQQYIEDNGLLLESQKNRLGGNKIEQIITSKDKNKVIANDSQLRTVLNNAYKLFGDDIKIKLPLTKIDGSQSSFEGTFDAISERVKEDTQEETN